jgi:hypothetical protein
VKPASEDASKILAAIRAELGHDPTRPPAYLTEVETAAVLHQKRSNIRNWRYAGSVDLPWKKVGAVILYLAEDVAHFLLTTSPGADR